MASLAALANLFCSVVNRLIKRKILSYHTLFYLNVYGQAQQKKSNFPSKTLKNWSFLVALEKLATLGQIFCSGIDRPIEFVISSYQTPLYLKGYGQGHQKAEFWPKTNLS